MGKGETDDLHSSERIIKLCVWGRGKGRGRRTRDTSRTRQNRRNAY